LLTFTATNEFGARWEKGVAITDTGYEVLSGPIGTLHELNF